MKLLPLSLMLAVVVLTGYLRVGRRRAVVAFGLREGRQLLRRRPRRRPRAFSTRPRSATAAFTGERQGHVAEGRRRGARIARLRPQADQS